MGCSAPCSAPYLDRCDVRGPGVDGARAICSRVGEGGGWGQLRRRAVLMGVCPTTRERGSEPLLKSCILCSHGTHKYVQKCARCCEHACEDGVLFRGKGKRAGREGRVGSGGQTNGARLVDVGFHSVIGSLWQMGEEKGENHASSACRTLPVRAVLENCSPDPAVGVMQGGG